MLRKPWKGRNYCHVGRDTGSGAGLRRPWKERNYSYVRRKISAGPSDDNVRLQSVMGVCMFMCVGVCVSVRLHACVSEPSRSTNTVPT